MKLHEGKSRLAAKAYLGGAKVRAIAINCNVSLMTVYKWLDKEGVKRRDPYNHVPPMTMELKRQIERAVLEGHTAKTIGATVLGGVSYGRAFQVLRKLGLKTKNSKTKGRVAPLCGNN